MGSKNSICSHSCVKSVCLCVYVYNHYQFMYTHIVCIKIILLDYLSFIFCFFLGNLTIVM